MWLPCPIVHPPYPLLFFLNLLPFNKLYDDATYSVPADSLSSSCSVSQDTPCLWLPWGLPSGQGDREQLASEVPTGLEFSSGTLWHMDGLFSEWERQNET
mgnify:CR=1 FL=1